MQEILIGTILLLGLTFSAESRATAVRLRRSQSTIDVSLKTPVLNPLTERTSVDTRGEQSMIVTPMTIQLLGQLLIVSSFKDVSIRAFQSNRHFELIRHPDSLRATLLQVSHEGYQAFLSAHSTMNTVQLRMALIPKHIKTALKLLAGNYPRRVLTRLLPMVLGNIEETGAECVVKSNATENEFTRVMHLINEVIQTTTATQSIHEDAVVNNRIQLEVLRAQKEDLEKAKAFREKLYKAATEGANRAEETYYKALNDMPTGLGALLKDFARGILKFMDKVAETGASVRVGAMFEFGWKGSSTRGSVSSMGQAERKQPRSFALEQTLEMVYQFSNSLRSFNQALHNNNGDKKTMDGHLITFKAFREFIEGLPENPAKARALQLIARGERLAEKASAEAMERRSENGTNSEITEELQEINRKLQAFQSAYRLANPNSFSSVTPASSGTGDSSQNELFVAQLAQTQLIERKRRQDEQTEQYLKLIDNMHKINTKIANLNLATIHYRQIIGMLQEAFGLLGQVRTQWNNFVLSFARTSEHITEMIKGPLRRFVQHTSLDAEVEHAMRMRLVDSLKDETFGIHREAYILSIMARTYYEVSSQYLMGRLASLFSLLAARNETQRQQLIQSLQNQTNQTLQKPELSFSNVKTPSTWN